jgi:PIN domain nuclease of toxin-antitoxin system
MSSEYVLDSSAVLAILQEEPGAELVVPLLKQSSIGIINLAEVYSVLLNLGVSEEDAKESVALLALKVEPDDEELAFEIGRLRRLTRPQGLSLGDRACLALATRHTATAVTADQAWRPLAMCPILLIR